MRCSSCFFRQPLGGAVGHQPEQRRVQVDHRQAQIDLQRRAVRLKREAEQRAGQRRRGQLNRQPFDKQRFAGGSDVVHAHHRQDDDRRQRIERHHRGPEATEGGVDQQVADLGFERIFGAAGQVVGKMRPEKAVKGQQ